MDVSRPRWLDKCHVGRINHMSVGPDDDNRVHNYQGKLYAFELMDEITKCSFRMGTFLFRCFSGWRILLNRVRKLHHPYWINRRNESMVHLSSFMLTRIPNPKAATPVGEGLPPVCWLHPHYSHMPCPVQLLIMGQRASCRGVGARTTRHGRITNVN